jgi:hypothetical protein
LQFVLHDETETYPGRQPSAMCDLPPAHSTARGGAAGDSVLDAALWLACVGNQLISSTDRCRDRYRQP